MIKVNKQILQVSFNYYEERYLKNIKKANCLRTEISDFLYNWSLETVRQFGKSILNTIPGKIYISKASELENLNQLNKAEKILKIFDIFNLEKVDKLEIISLFPFIVERNFENAFYCSVEFFSNEFVDKMTRAECYLFIDTLLRSIYKLVLVENEEESAQISSSQLVRIHDNSLNELLNVIFDSNNEEINHVTFIEKIKSMKLYQLLLKIHVELNNSQQIYEEKFTEELLKNML